MKLSQALTTLSQKSLASIRDKQDVRGLPPPRDIDNMIYLQLMLSAELSRLYDALDRKENCSTQFVREF